MHIKTMVILLSTSEDEILNRVNNRTSEVAPEGLSPVDNVLQLIGLVLLLVFILVAAYYTSRFIGKLKMGQMKNSNFDVIDVYRISPNKMLQLVKIANKYVVIGISKDNVTFITELDESEVITKEVHQEEKQNFKHVFENLLQNRKK